MVRIRQVSASYLCKPESGKGILTEQTLIHWIEAIFATQEHEIDCNQFQNHLPAFVEAELAATPLPHTAVLTTHLQHCPDCQEIYEGLRLVVSETTEPSAPGNSAVSPMPTGD